MHYIYRTLYIISILMLVASCESNDTLLEAQEDVKVSFTATLQELQTRSLGDGAMVNRLYVAVYNKETTETGTIRKDVSIDGLTVDFSIKLAKNQPYDIVFWAQHEECEVYNIDDLKAIEMDFNSIGNDFETVEKMDAFYATASINTKAMPSTYTIEMIRPLAQVNVGTSGNGAKKATFTIADAPTTFKPFAIGKVGETTADLTVTYNTLPRNKTIEVEGNPYNQVALAYLFAPKDKKAVLNCTLDLEMGEGEDGESVTHTFTDVHFQSNKRTNIVGAFTN